ncbi:MAG TPA: BspA family leucine-rich repeat surface protein [Arachidicoccus sp.]|nr:BspA family leucine-rich repeat surface protein [Arachidicoccus sp.]
MKRNLLLFVIISLLNLGAKATPARFDASLIQAGVAITDGFITTWETTVSNESILIPINPAYATDYNYTVNWGDGTSSVNQTGNASHTYVNTGIHTVTITGEFPAIQFNNPASDAVNDQKILTVVQWGNGTWKGMDAAFRFCQKLTTVPNNNGPIFEPNSTLYSMFFDCIALNCDLNNWDLTNVREISEMFHGATAFNGNISDWNVSNVTNMQNIFYKALVFNGDISNWNVSKVELMDNMFANASAFNGDISRWNVGSVREMNNMFSQASSFNQDISQWDVSNVTTMSFMFSNASSFNQNLSNWNVSKVTNMSNIFEGATAFNGDISTWDVSHVTSMIYMFNGCVGFNQDLSTWNVSAVSDMTGMFSNAVSFNQDISSWDVHAVKNMRYMFSRAVAFNQDIGNWQTNSLTDMDHILYQANSFNQNIEDWNVANVTNMNYAFYFAAAFDQNLGKWNIGQVASMENMLDASGLSAFNYESTLNGWAAQTVQQGVALGANGLKFCSSTGHQSLVDEDGWEILNDRQVCLVPALPDGAGIVYVDSAVVAPGDGSSWNNALKYLSNAIESAKTNTDIKEVHIAKGTYYPTGDKSLVYRDSTFLFTRPGLKIFGGYSNADGSRDFNLFPTVLSGDIGISADTIDNSMNVIVINNIADGTDSLILDGLTITEGKASLDSDFNGYGFAGGISITNAFANTVISNCKLVENYGMIGSAMAVLGMATYDDVNPSMVYDPQILNCLFKDNKVIELPESASSPFGSTIINSGVSPYFSHCDFIDNTGLMGGAVINYIYTAPVFNSCNFSGNRAKGISVIYNMEGANAVLVNCSVTNNVNTGYVSAMIDPVLSRLFSNAVIGNMQFSHSSIINTTIANNKSIAPLPSDGPLILNLMESSTYMTNSIIWGNKVNTISDSLTSALSKISYSLIQGLAADPSNHLLDGTTNQPVFVDTTNGNFQLASSSPAINTGFNDSLILALSPYIPGLSEGGLDLAGNTRIKDVTIDMGPYEFSGPPLPVTLQSFTAEWQNHLAVLHWNSGVEVNLAHYDIETSVNGKNFRKISSTDATGSNGTYVYQTTQLEPTAYYRLKAVDINGKFDYSSIAKLVQNGHSKEILLYPNPAKNYINVSIGAQNSLLIYNAGGSLVKSVNLKAGVNNIDISHLSSGVYFGIVNGQKLQFFKQ